MIQPILIGSMLALCLTGCGPHPRKASLSTDLSGPSREILEATTAEIEALAGGRIIHADVADFRIKVLFGPLEAGTLGESQGGLDEDCTIVISDVMKPSHGFYNAEDLRHLFIHEIGHCFGLEHSESPSSIMYFEYDRKQNTPEAFRALVKDLNDSRSAW